MLNLRLGEVALWTRGRLVGTDAVINAVITDSRRVGPGALFVALKGEHADGHDFVAAAATRGAAGALVSRRIDCSLPQIVVDDVLLALGDLASAVRAQRCVTVVGITGSSGKTTIKGLLATILARRGRTHVTAGNYNNEIGLPLTLLAMPEDVEYAVLEMGAGKPGDIAYLAAIARPQVALVSNIAPAHLERLGTVDGVAATKGAIYEALPADGVAVINADDAFAGFFAGLAGSRRVLRFGLGSAAEVSAAELVLAADGSRFRLMTPAGVAMVRLPLPGRHNVHNALAAAAIAIALEMPLADIVAGLETAQRGARPAGAARDGRRLDPDRRQLQRQPRFGGRGDRHAGAGRRRDLAGPGRHGRAGSGRRDPARRGRRAGARRGHRAAVHGGSPESRGQRGIRCHGSALRRPGGAGRDPA